MTFVQLILSNMKAGWPKGINLSLNYKKFDRELVRNKPVNFLKLIFTKMALQNQMGYLKNIRSIP